jgi:hypothetical protein
MIDDLDRSIEKLLTLEFGGALPFDLSFAPPNKDFAPVSGTKNTLNCYLYDIRDDRELRQTIPYTGRNADGTFSKKYPPARVRTAYCITAWSPVTVAAGIPPSLDEHKLLSDVLRILLKYPELPATAMVGLLAGQQPAPPTTVIMPETDKIVADFWTAVGGQLRPSLDYRVTISLDFIDLATGPLVTTQISRFVQSDLGGPAEQWMQIGGFVVDNAVPPNAQPNAWVRMDTGLPMVTDALGRFVFAGVTPGAHTIHARSAFRDGSRTVTVPDPTGDYNVVVT